jgi:hypothetical protein
MAQPGAKRSKNAESQMIFLTLKPPPRIVSLFPAALRGLGLTQAGLSQVEKKFLQN